MQEVWMHELDAALEAVMADPTAPQPSVGPQLAALLRLAGELRELPDAAFRARLAADLLARARGENAGASPERATDFATHDLGAALAGLPDATMRFIGTLDRSTLGVTRFSERLAWERHPDGDELLHLLEGEAEITTLTDDGPQRAQLSAGSLFVCRRGLWHRIEPRTPVAMLFATPGEGTEHSDADDPRQEPGRAPSGAPRALAADALVAHDLGAALAGVDGLSITARTTGAEADAAFHRLTTFDQYTLGVMRFSGRTPWERHPDGDELLHALDGEVEVSLLTDEGPLHTRLRAGSVLVCPRGLWHRQFAAEPVTMLFATATETSQISFADDPRTIQP
jgi:quercetin dioxygenase-like cupin family protein